MKAHPCFRPFRSLRFQIILIIIAALIPSFFLTFHISAKERRHAIENSRNEARIVALEFSSKVNAMIEGGRSLLKGIAELPELKERRDKELSDLFRDMLRHYPAYTAMATADSAGNMFAASMPIRNKVNLSDREYFNRIKRNKSFTVGDYQFGRLTGKPVIILAYPVLDRENELKSIATVSLDLHYVAELAADIQMPANSTVSIIDAKGTVLARHPFVRDFVGRLVPDAPEMLEKLQKEDKDYFEKVGLDENLRLYVLRPISNEKENRLFIRVGIPVAPEYNRIERGFVLDMVMIVLVAVFAILFSSMLMNRLLVDDVYALKEGTKLLAEGDMNFRISAGGRSQEAEELISAFNSMAESLLFYSRGLIEAQNELEKRVVDRTREWSEANARLKMEIGERTRYEKELEFKREVDSIVAELTGELFKPLSVEKVSELILEAGVRLTGSKAGFAGAFDPLAGRVRNYCLIMKEDVKCDVPNKTKELNESCGVLGWILNQALPVIINDMSADSRHSGFPEGHPNIRNFLSAPAVINDKPVGIIAFANSESGYDQDDLNLINRLTALYSQVIQRKFFEGELIGARIRAEDGSKAKTEFLARMSHEIRTPLNAVINMTELVLETKLDTEQSGYLETVKNAAGHLLSVVNDVLDISKIEAGKLDFEFIDFDLVDMLMEAGNIFRPQAERKKLDFVVTIDEDVPRYVKSDPNRIRQILINLIGNSVKFTNQGMVSVSLSVLGADALIEGQNESRPDPDKVNLVFRVEDTGIGIAKEARNKVFDLFSQADGSITRKFGGTGLGLSISRHLVEMLGGAISLESEENRGSVFKFSIPVDPGNPEVASSGMKNNDLLKGRCADNINVLVVEDNENNIKVALALLGKYVKAARVAGNGQEALNILATQRFDLVFMDVEMPVMDGIEATRRIRAGEAGDGNKGVRIVAMTAHALSHYRELCLQAGMDDYIHKPLDIRQIYRVLSLVCGLDYTEVSTGPDAAPRELLNRAEALRRFDGDEELYSEVCADFLGNYTQRSAEIGGLVAGLGDTGTLIIRAHGMKSFCANIGADSCVVYAESLEQAARNGDMTDAQEAFQSLEKELRKVAAVLSAD